MKMLDKILRRIITRIESYNFIRTKTKRWNEGNLVINKARIVGDVVIGRNCKIIGGVQIDAGSPVRIGDYTSLSGPNTDIHAKINPVQIGNFCSIARSVSIQEYNHHLERLTSYFVFHNIFKEQLYKDINSRGPVEIGHDVWIGAHCVILSGAKIGNGAIIAANSVITGEIPPFAIVGGTPAKVIKYRFDETLINKIQELQWWNWPIERIKANRQLFEGRISIEKLNNIV